MLDNLIKAVEDRCMNDNGIDRSTGRTLVTVWRRMNSQGALLYHLASNREGRGLCPNQESRILRKFRAGISSP